MCFCTGPMSGVPHDNLIVSPFWIVSSTKRFVFKAMLRLYFSYIPSDFYSLSFFSCSISSTSSFSSSLSSHLFLGSCVGLSFGLSLSHTMNLSFWGAHYCRCDYVPGPCKGFPSTTWLWVCFGLFPQPKDWCLKRCSESKFLIFLSPPLPSPPSAALFHCWFEFWLKPATQNEFISLGCSLL